MKNLNLSAQILLTITLITVLIGLALIGFLPRILSEFFTEEIYRNIEHEQNTVFRKFDANAYRDFVDPSIFDTKYGDSADDRTVKHFIVYNDHTVIFSSPTNKEFVEVAKKKILNQLDPSQRYELELDDDLIFFTITKGFPMNKPAYLVSFISDSYLQDMVRSLYLQILKIILVAMVISWFFAFLLSRFITKPISSLEGQVEKLASMNLSQPVKLDRKDEIGRLAQSIEKLRKQLIRQDESEQSFLQNISHELKTPVMVIRSYAQAIGDGIYPSGSIEDSLEIIDKEAELLESRIENLLYINKLDYLTDKDMVLEDLSLDRMIQEVVYRLCLKREDVKFNLDLINSTIRGDSSQWRIVIENLIDNQLRYAKSQINISIKEDEDNYLLSFINDGDPIEEELLKTIFNKFTKGPKGKVGLGLAIVKSILSLHKAEIWAENLDGGVGFFIKVAK